MLELNPARVTAAVLLINEVFHAHDEAGARKFHPNDWQDYLASKYGKAHLDPNQILQDAQRSKLLVETVANLLGAFNVQMDQVVRLRFGLDDGRQRTLREVGDEMDYSPERIRQIQNKATRFLRHPTLSRRLLPFLEV